MQTRSRPTVFVVDDDEAVRKAMSLLIRSAGLEVSTFHSGEAFLDSYTGTQPGCLVLDVRMPGMSGTELQETLSARGIQIPIIFITGHGDVPMAVRAVQKGAVDFIQKPFDDQVLLDRIEKAIQIDVKQRVEAQRRSEIAARLERLTPREREVMDLLMNGQGNKEIALKLGLSRKTVDIHRSHVMMKLGIDSLAELLKIGLLHSADQAKPSE